MNNRNQFILICLCVIAALGFVGYQIYHASGARTYGGKGSFKILAKLAEHTESGVRVEVSLESDAQSGHLLRSTFTPDQGFHLYSKDLDPKSVDGLGMPTNLELQPSSSIKATGPVFANVEPRIYYHKEMNVSLPIYPDGPVTLRLPIQIVTSETDISARIKVSYMACDAKGICRNPVEGQVLEITISR
jgi:hypothetical protein